MKTSYLKTKVRDWGVNAAKAINHPIIKNRKSILNSSLGQVFADSNILKLSNKGNVASGYVPYVEQSTKVQLYHFFSFNYGHRKPFKVLISLFGDGTSPLCSKLLTLETRTSVCLDIDHEFSEFSNLRSVTSCVVSIIHERVAPNHAGHEGHLRFWGIYGDDGAFVHSMPLPSSLNMMRKGFSKNSKMARRCFHSNAQAISCFSIFGTTVDVKERGDIDDLSIAPNGYVVAKNKDHKVVGCWHTAGKHAKNLTADEVVETYAIHIPPIPNIDGQLYFKECCNEDARLSVIVFQLSGNETAPRELYQCDITANLSIGLRLSEIIPVEILKQKDIWLKVSPLKGAFSERHLNIIYSSLDSNEPLDCVHNHHFQKARGNCMKFAPFSESLTKESWVGVNGAENMDVKVRFRITLIDNPHAEFIVSKDIPRNVVKYFRVSDLVDLDKEIKHRGVVQIESVDSNVGCSMFIVNGNKNSFTLAADHFTGG